MPLKIFFCYAHEDEPLLNKLKMHLRPLQREGLIDVWYDRDINAGTEWEQEISEQLNAAQIILLLVSPDFMNSDYCYGIEMKRALERHERGEATVIPIILRHIYWQGEPLGKFQALPTDARPITDPSWHNLDMAFYNVTEGIRKLAVNSLTKLKKQNLVEPNVSTQISYIDSATKIPKFGNILRYQRKLQGWSQADVAARIQVDIKTIGRWERGKAFPGPYLRQKLVELFGKNISELGLIDE